MGKSKQRIEAIAVAVFSVGKPCVVVRSEGIGGEVVTVRPGYSLIGYDPDTDDDYLPHERLDPPR